MSTSTLTAPETTVEDMDEELEDILGRVDACAKLSRSLISEHDSTRDGRGITEDADTLLRRSLDVSMELQMVAARFSAMWGSQVRARVGPEGWPRDVSAASVSAAEAARSRRLSLGKATKAVQKCFEAEREGLLREIRALEARNRKCGLTIRGLETRKEREEHLAKRCRTLQERVDDGRANLDAVKRQLERSQTHAADTDRVRRLLEDEVVQLRREKQELDARLEAQEHEAARTLREQTRQLARDLEAEREAHAAAREAWHQSKLEADLIRRQVDIKESALREKDRHAEEAGDILRETTGTLRTKLKQAENRAFAAEEAIAGARAEADGVRAELTEQLNDLRAKLARTEDLRQDAVLETRDLREQLARRHSGSEDTDTLSLQRQVARLCEANTALRAERDRAERTSERALGALRQARLLEETVSQLRAQIRDRDETIHQLTVHYRSPEQHEQLAIVAAESANLTTMNDAPSCTGGDAVDISFTLSP
ncbi:Hypothetical Protein FCC1311_054702 [Hondaea fermentalgiana]|uniref:Uncharacterized protein n=1 Tax=Hondaea fermentalgiana TaxID=2315210 RepID=A0A2R5GHQ0_9STRA|nr:Hypothetical Protein FCC1311_054702 [Hondaea fermentalgiana]|eukprot:GBG29248.1 Hypothetical Protein FCC1311_054702 [Hondaea fermentalgiana]